MSHASLIVALSPEVIQQHESPASAIAWAMEPFDENGEWFADGSRWDCWQIGGRFSAKFAPDYDPTTDAANTTMCELCDGTGKRCDVVLALHGGPLPIFAQGGVDRLFGGDRGEPWNEQRLQDYLDNKGCNGCGGTGRHLKPASQWRDIGNVTMRGEIEHLADKLTAYGFLETNGKRRWHERGRMGWWGCSAATECEIKSKQQTGEEYTGRCIHRDEQMGGEIVSWAEDDNERWDRLFWARFIRRLPPDTTLVCVDYHV